MVNQNETGLIVYDEQVEKGLTTGFKVTFMLIVLLIVIYMVSVNNSFRQFKYKIMGIGNLLKPNKQTMPPNGYMPVSLDDKENVYRL